MRFGTINHISWVIKMLEPLVYAVSPIIADALTSAVKAYLEKAGSAPDKIRSEEEEHIVTPVFGSYVTRNAGFAKELQSLNAIVKAYVDRPDVGRPLNILLAAEPGSGKSFLIKQLAESIAPKEERDKFPFLEFHVAAFSSSDDLYGILHRVQSLNLQGKLPFILFDEVDGKVAGQHILAKFLAPMWDGKFHLARETFTLGKAVFAFAASAMVPAPSLHTVLGEDIEKLQVSITYEDFKMQWENLVAKSIRSGNDNSPDRIEKKKDFLDRIDRIVCIPPVHKILSGEAAAKEQVDIAFLLTTKHFKKVRRIEKAVLHVLISEKLVKNTSRRVAEKCIFCSQLKDPIIFRYQDLPGDDQSRYSESADVKQQLGQFLSFELKKAQP